MKLVMKLECGIKLGCVLCIERNFQETQDSPDIRRKGRKNLEWNKGGIYRQICKGTQEEIGRNLVRISATIL